jgi:hypothetical protein
VLPIGWHELKEWRLEDIGRRYQNRISGMTVLLSGRVELDGKRWVHLSVSYPDRLPTWEDLVYAKELFMGRESRALQVIPPRSEYINLHPYVLHLWSCIDGDVTPDFRHGENQI